MQLEQKINVSKQVSRTEGHRWGPRLFPGLSELELRAAEEPAAVQVPDGMTAEAGKKAVAAGRRAAVADMLPGRCRPFCREAGEYPP